MTENDIRAALASFNLKDMLEGVHVQGGLVQVSLAVKREEAPRYEALRREIEAKLSALPGVQNAAVVLTAQKPPAPAPAPAAPQADACCPR